MSIFGKASQILGINARNLLYIVKYNSKAHKKLADDKISTKHFLQARGIGVARLYSSVKTLAELRNFNPSTLPNSFVIKPNKGYGGEGILPINKTQKGIYHGVNGEKYRWSDLYEHCIGILDGRYAISGLRDTVIFEELLEPHDYFKKFVEMGLPDIRVIVFKYVPVIAMLRLPTAESQGKANLHLGAIGLGIDIGTGQTTFGVYKNKLIKKMPSGESVRSLIIPQWDEILNTASRTQFLTQIGYLAVDLTLAKNGIKILEVNARAGLAIQISNQTLLRKRLEKVADLKVVSAAEGVKIGKTLFTRVVKEEKATNTKLARPIIGLFEPINILNAKGFSHVQAKIDPHSESNYLDKSIQIPPEDRLASIKLKDRKIKIPFILSDLSNQPYKVILSGKHLTDFLIDSAKKTSDKIEIISAETKEEKIIQNIDKKIVAINDQIHLLARLKPLNLEEEYKKFIKHPSHSPQFSYQKHDLNIDSIKSDLKKIPRQVNHPLMPLYQKKIEEIYHKIGLVENIGRREMSYYSNKIFGAVNEELYNQAVNFLKNEPLQKDASKKLSLDEVVRQISDYLNAKKLIKWRIKILDNATSGMQINKKNTIFINKKGRFTQNHVTALIAHEIETHIFRLENGRLQPYRLFEQGTAGYLLAEEGLAIYNQNKLRLPLGDKYFSPALNIVAIYFGQRMSFLEIYDFLIKNYNIPKEKAWRICVRTKRGLENTNEPGSLTKDLVYFSGYNLINRLIKDKGLNEMKKLYIGKIGFADLKYISDLKQWKIKYLPEFK
ncbi:MAG: tyrosine/phenylalanine carboxypeptidase domain-containing protein [Patescibacteria group bacterium]|jgi:alpha-L-glutamate ligase-like protein